MEPIINSQLPEFKVQAFHTLHDLEISTIERKMSNTETNCTILLERNSS